MLFLLFIIKQVINYLVSCDHNGTCLITTLNSKDKNVKISEGLNLLYQDKKGITKKWNKSNTPLLISSQINGVSKYGILKGKKGYECSGGLWECIDSCCLDGFCVQILHYCKSEVDNVELIYIICGSSFVFLISIYWMTYFIIGWNFNKNYFVSEEKEEQGYGKFNNCSIYNNNTQKDWNETEDNFFKKEEKFLKRNNTATFGNKNNNNITNNNMDNNHKNYKNNFDEIDERNTQIE